MNLRVRMVTASDYTYGQRLDIATRRMDGQRLTFPLCKASLEMAWRKHKREAPPNGWANFYHFEGRANRGVGVALLLFAVFFSALQALV